MKILLYSSSRHLLNEWVLKIAKNNINTVLSDNDFFKEINVENFDVVCLDARQSLEQTGGFIKEVLSMRPELKIFVLADEPNFNEGREYIALGAKGYGNAHMLAMHFNDSLEAICGGDVWLYPEFIQNMIQIMTKDMTSVNSIDMLENLTLKEKEIANLVYKGFTNQEISDNLNISIRTVKAHMSSIFEKTGVKDRINLVLMMQNRD